MALVGPPDIVSCVWVHSLCFLCVFVLELEDLFAYDSTVLYYMCKRACMLYYCNMV